MNCTDRSKRFMLIVDSNVDDRFHISMLLQQFGHNTFTATTAEEALVIISVTPPAAVFAEAGKTGTIILTGIKKNTQFFDIPLILLSTTPNAILEGRARRGDFAGFLRKPIDAKKLYLTVESAVLNEPRRKIRLATSLRPKLVEERGSEEGLVTVLPETGMFSRTYDSRPMHNRLTVDFEIKG
jgi:CheY-like chemotaxis protein